MKTYENELDEMIDVVVKLIWNYTIICKLFEKKEIYTQVREAYPQFFITMYESLLCSLCVTIDLLFCKKQKATSLCNLIKDIESSRPEFAKGLNEKISLKDGLIEKIGGIRNQVCAHRWEAKTPKEVFAEVGIKLNMIKEIADLAQLIVSELAEEAGGNRRENMEQLKLNKETLQFTEDSAVRVMAAFAETL
jgi:hypothetical protein